MEKYPASSRQVDGQSIAYREPIDGNSTATTTEKIQPPRLAGIDGRSAEAQRFRRTWQDLAAALGRDPSPVERTLLTDAAILVMEVEALAARSVAGGEGRPDPDVLVRVSGALSRALDRLGLTTTPEPPTVDPAEHAKRIREPSYWENQ